MSVSTSNSESQNFTGKGSRYHLALAQTGKQKKSEVEECSQACTTELRRDQSSGLCPSALPLSGWDGGRSGLKPCGKLPGPAQTSTAWFPNRSEHGPLRAHGSPCVGWGCSLSEEVFKQSPASDPKPSTGEGPTVVFSMAALPSYSTNSTCLGK